MAPTSRLRRPLVALLAALAAAVVLAACGGGGSGLAALELAPKPLPSATFTDTSDQSYDPAAHAKGVITVLYFGYTNCPDVCPTTMADLGKALRTMPKSVAQDVQVVFVTSDPARDTTAVMRTWLGHFDAGVPRPFIGLRSDVATTDAYGGKLGIALAPPTTGKDGTVEVTHGDSVIIVDPKGVARWVWLEGVASPASTYAADLEKIHAGNA